MPLGEVHEGLEAAQLVDGLLEELAIGQALRRSSVWVGRRGGGLELGWGPVVHGGDSRLCCRLMGIDVSVAAAAAVKLATKDDLDGHMDRIAHLLERPHARYHRLHGARAPRAGNNPFVIKLDTPRPPAGWLWELQWAMLVGDDPASSTAIANVRAMLLIGAAPTDASLTAGAVGAIWGGLDYAGVVLNGLVVPSAVTTIPDKNVAHTDEEVYAVVAGSGTVAGSGFYHLTVAVIEKPQTADSLLW